MLTHVRRLSWKEEFLLLTQVLVQLGISPETAADACKVEHNLSEEPFEKNQSTYRWRELSSETDLTA